MTDCRVPRDELLEADLHELTGDSDSEIGLHVRACSTCAEAAQRILATNRALDAALHSPPPLDVQALVARAKFVAVPGVENTEDHLSGRAPARRRPNGPGLRQWRRWAGMAAAAAIAALLLARPGNRPLPGVELHPVAVAPAALDVPPGHNLAVIQTDNPDITVLWFF